MEFRGMTGDWRLRLETWSPRYWTHGKTFDQGFEPSCPVSFVSVVVYVLHILNTNEAGMSSSPTELGWTWFMGEERGKDGTKPHECHFTLSLISCLTALVLCLTI